MKIAIIGTGYVGLTTGACFAAVGHDVICVDIDRRKVDALNAGQIPIYEPGLEDIVKDNVAAGRLTFSTSTADAVAASEVIFIAVGTPPQPDGSVDLRFVETVAREIAAVLPADDYRVVVTKSTVPVTTGDRVTATIQRYARPGVQFDVVSNPEFLREGSAVEDLMKPDRIVVGSNSRRALDLLWKIYEPFPGERVEVDLNSAEIIKHAANSFLAMKISFINAVASICDQSGADVEKVAHGIGLDNRIGKAFLNAGLGYGGSCFPKDVAAFVAVSRHIGVPFNLLSEVVSINESTLTRFLGILREKLWMLRDKKVGVLGIAFKANTDDLRESVSVRLIKQLIDEGAQIVAFDPKGSGNFAREHAEWISRGEVVLAERAEDVAQGADAIIIATEWPEFRDLDYASLRDSMRVPLILDGRNLLDPASIIPLGFDYVAVGRAGAIAAARNAQSS